MDSFKITTAVPEQAGEIALLYRSLIGTPGCTWNENYPTIEDVKEDIQRGALYIVCGGGKIVAAAAAGEDDGMEQLTCWSPEIRHPCQLSRVGVMREYQGRGIAGDLIRQIERDAAARGFDGIRFLVGRRNAKALALYKSLDCRCCGETDRYGQDWYCYEKNLNLSAET